MFIGNYTASNSTTGFDMAEEIKIETTEKTRRSAIKTAAQVAVTAPAVGLLLSASTKAASAQSIYGLRGDDVAFADNPINGNNDQFTNGGNADDFISQGDDLVHGTI